MREVTLLRTENEILHGKVKGGGDGRVAGSSFKTSSSETERMLTLTRKAQDTQKALDKMKGEVKELRQV